MNIGLAIVRITLGLYLAAHGLQKMSPRLGFGGIQGTAEGFAREGMRGGRVPAVLAATMQFGTGVLLAIGLITPLAAMGAAGVMIVATETRFPAGFWSQRGGFEYPAFLSVICLALIWSGGGRYSVDAVLSLHSPAWGLAVGASIVSVAAASLAVIALRARGVRHEDHPVGRPA